MYDLIGYWYITESHSRINFTPFIFPSRSDVGVYTGVDSTNITVETNTVKMATTRKVSKMLNGLGDDM